jgi:hypothetical protein
LPATCIASTRNRVPPYSRFRANTRIPGYGNIKNDYDDYLGTGVPLRNNAELRSFVTRYTYRVKDNWFVGVQGIYQNFAIAGDTGFDDQVLDIRGVKPFKSAGAGLVVQNDSRQRKASS